MILSRTGSWGHVRSGHTTAPTPVTPTQHLLHFFPLNELTSVRASKTTVKTRVEVGEAVACSLRREVRKLPTQPRGAKAPPSGDRWSKRPLLAVTRTPLPQYYTCSCILAFVACSVFLRMSLELKVVLLTVALVAYLVFFHISLCSWWDCYGLSNLNDTLKPNDTLRWAHLTHCQDPSPPARLDGGPWSPLHPRLPGCLP